MITSSKDLSPCSDDIESRGQRNEFSAKNGQRRSLPNIDWDGYSKSGNKAASAWLICLFLVLGLSVQQASLSTIVAENAAIRSSLDDASFASPDLAASSAAQMQRNMMEISEENPESSQSSSLEASGDTIEEEPSKTKLSQLDDKSPEERLKTVAKSHPRVD